VEQSRKESGDSFTDCRIPEEAGYHRGTPLGSDRKHRGRSFTDEITLFKSHGIAIWDVAVELVYAEAVRLGKGRELELDD